MHKTALITGGTRGIGFGIAKILAGEGYNLALNGRRDEEQVKSVLDVLRSGGTEVIYIMGDIGSKKDRGEILETIRKKFGSINLVVNNAGMAPRERKDILEAGEESYDEVMQVNLKGPYFLTQAAANMMIASKKINAGFSACIITISSVSATLASVNRGDYCLSKAGLAMMTRLFAARLGEYNIPVYEIRPGIVTTDMTKGVRDKYDKMIEEGLLVQKRWGTPEDIGKIVAMLARGDLTYSTGQVIMADGGMTVGRL
jgi:NAD(P)-dependent dehydrogenase (short-subunit alcohol dehydrogenase family)